MNFLRERFFRLSLRERLIAVVLLGAGALFWTSSVIGGFRDAVNRNARVAAELEFQETVLSRSESVEAEIAGRLEEMEARRSLTASSFVEEVDRISRNVGLTPDMDPVESRSGDMVSIHRLDMDLDDVALVPLIDFVRRMEDDGLPVSIEQMLLSVNQRMPEEVDAVLRLSGFEFAAGSSRLASAP